ncbi:MAG: aldo/keto reductase, partial [Acholeplasmatales bacterium]|nr:aldo/keto reductase [Acholeplasmatales bacterium]
MYFIIICYIIKYLKDTKNVLQLMYIYNFLIEWSVFMKKLGFGMMRLPLLDVNDQTAIDFEQVNKMVDRYLEMGFNYFDTAY